MKNFSFCKVVGCYTYNLKTVKRNTKKKNWQRLCVLLVLFFAISGFSFTVHAASIYFNVVYIGSGSSYTLNSNSINSISPVLGNGFKFTSPNPADAQFTATGNNVNGTFSYVNTSGVVITKTGTVSRIFKSGNTTDGLFFLVDGTGVAYNLVIPGRENQFVSGNSYSSAGNSALADMNALLVAQAPQSVVSISDAVATEGNSYINFTVSFTNNSSRTVTNTFTPYITDNTAVVANDITLPIQYSFDGATWTNLSSSISVANTQSTVQIRVEVVDDAIPETDETFTLNTGTISGAGILNSAGAYGTGTIKDNYDPLVWTGSVSSALSDAANWSPSILPQSTFAISIPASLSRYPLLTQNLQCYSLTIASGANFNLGSYNVELSNNLINNGSIIASTGNIILNGVSTQTINGSGSIANLTINNTNGISISSGNNIQGITGILTVQAGTFNTIDNLTLKCVNNNVGTIAAVTGTIIGNITVERCIPSGKRSYRFLTPVVTTTTSIHDNWQEGATSATNNPKPGYGTHITGTLVDQTNGLDATSTGNPSLYVFNNATQAWSAITNTNVNTFNAGSAYRIMIRGDRAVDLNTQPANNTATILRTTGTVTTGTVTFGTATSTPSNMPKLAANAGEFSFIGNPYPSAIDWSTVSKTGITGYYYIWDPTIGSRGAYVSCFNDGTKSIQSSNVTAAIQLGQGFFVKNTSVGEARQIVISESNKVNSLSNVFRTQNTSSVIKMQLYLTATYNTGGNAQDGAVVLYNSSFSNEVNDDDAAKLTNLDENIAIQRGSSLMSIERRNIQANGADTIQLKLWQLSNSNYTLKLDANYFENATTAYLYDVYTNTSTPLNITSVTEVNFSVTTDVASINPNRFTIILNSNNALPVTFKAVNAFSKNGGITVEWLVANELNLSKYEVEKSVDGIHFTLASGIDAAGKNVYSYFDAATMNGNNYYRIKAIDKNAAIQYSSIVTVKLNKNNTSITVLNNPIKNKLLAIQFDVAKAGIYTIQLLNNLGQLVERKQINCTAGSSIQKIELTNVINGLYQLQITGKDTIIYKSVILE